MTCSIQRLTAEGLEGAVRLSSTAGWNQRPEDWRMLLELAPAGSFAAVHAGQIVGTAIGIDYARFSWIAMMLVDPAYRGRGLGRRLLEAAIDALPVDRPIRLDATPMGRPLYESHGFRDETGLTRYVLNAEERVDQPPPGPAQPVTAMAAADLEAVDACDPSVFHGVRRRLLQWALEGAPQYARIARTAEGLPQYCFGRPGRLFDQIGPVVAADTRAACALVASALAPAAGAVVVDAFDEPGDFAAWLRGCGFRAQRPLYRMRRPPARGAGGPPDDPQHVLTEFAIAGPEFA